MVLLPKQWKSRSSPGFAGGVEQNPFAMFSKAAAGQPSGGLFLLGSRSRTVGAGWSSPVARQPHNVKDTATNPVHATDISASLGADFFRFCSCPSASVALSFTVPPRDR